MSVPPIEDDALPRRPWVRWVGLSLAIVLMGGVVWKLSSIGEWQGIVRSVRAASAWQVAALVGLPIVNLLLTSATFWSLTNRDEKGSPHVGLGEMTAVIAAAVVMNYLPVKAGMLGRIAYHKLCNGVSVRRSVSVIIVELIISAAACALLVVAAVLAMRVGMVHVAVWLAFPIALGALATLVLRAARRSAWRIAFALVLQYADMVAWGGRYVICFGVMGVALSWTQSAALTAVAQVATIVPIGGSALGLREWTIGLVAPALPAWATQGAQPVATLAEGLSADLVNRAGELLALVPLGIAGSVWVARHVGRRRGKATQTHPGGGEN